MEARGVRSSWLTVETNSLFSCSTSRRSETSRMLPANWRPPSLLNSNIESSNGNSSPLRRRPPHSVMRPIARANAVRR